MKKIILTKQYENKKLDTVLKSLFPKLTFGAMCKAFRKKDVKVNGIRQTPSYIVCTNDGLEVFIIDDILYGKNSKNNFVTSKFFDLVYQDENLLIVNKMQGIAVHNDSTNDTYTLIDVVQKNLSLPFAKLCHRLDRNTGGLIIISKNQATLDLISEKIKNNEIKKYYKCLVHGVPSPKNATLNAYLFKDRKLSRVFIHDTKQKNTLEISTKYSLISTSNNASMLNVELLTGRTHQIRAHLSHIGLPIIGDGKYGLNKINQLYPYKFQALWAYKLIFKFRNQNHLSYLNNRCFEVNPDFK